MRFRPLFLFILLIAIASQLECAQAEICDSSKRFCGYWHGSGASSSSGAPTRGSKVRLNPSAVPVEKGFGAEMILFDGSADFALVKGLGRVGAAISPANSEETFFGPPGLELPEDLARRKEGQKKFPSQKLTLATAVGLINNKKSGMGRFEANIGVMGRYNKLTHAFTPGAGISGVAGAFTYGYSIYSDQTQLDYARYGLTTKPVIKYFVETYSVGAFLSSLAVDYSILRMVTNDVATTSVLTGTLLLRRCLFTVAARHELSSRPSYNYTLMTLETQRAKDESFFGLQVTISQHLMLGMFYNYYVLRELSLGAVLFF